MSSSRPGCGKRIWITGSVNEFREAAIHLPVRGTQAREEVEAVVDTADTDPLVGMALLDGHELTVQVVNDGNVFIRALP
jgi:hypothetical protein